MFQVFSLPLKISGSDISFDNVFLNNLESYPHQLRFFLHESSPACGIAMVAGISLFKAFTKRNIRTQRILLPLCAKNSLMIGRISLCSSCFFEK